MLTREQRIGAFFVVGLVLNVLVLGIVGFLVGLPFGIALSDHWKRNLLITLLLFGVYLTIVSGVATSVFR